MVYRFFLFLLCGSLFLSPHSTFAAMKPLPKIRVGVPPTEILKEVIRNEPPQPETTMQGAKEYAPLITWLVDPDERLIPRLVLSKNEDRIFTVTSIAAQFLPAMAAVDYGVLELLTPVLLITGHSESRFIRMFLEGYGDQDVAMRQALDHLHLPLHDEAVVAEGQTDLSEETFMAALEKNIDFQVQEAMHRYAQRIREGRLLVAGAIIDTGNVYGLGADRLVILNINGVTDPLQMRRMREVATIGQQAAALLGRRFGSSRETPAANSMPMQTLPANKQ